jgi:hypothetical protein
VRFHYQRSRSWADAHIHVHGESSALAYGIADQGLTKPPKTQKRHLPVGGRRFRPCLEDIIEFLVHELGVDHKPGWQRRADDGRQRWRDMQLAASLRDMIRADPDNAPDRLRRKIDEIVASMHQP